MKPKGKGKPGSTETRQAIDVVDGLPDRSPRAAGWKYILLLAAFVVWIALLVYIHSAGSPEP